MTHSNALAAFADLPPHMLLENAFGQETVAQLLAFAAQHEAEFKDTAVGVKSKSMVNKSIRCSRVMRNFGDLRPALEDKFRAAMPVAIPALGLFPFELAELSLELAVHGDGDFYQRHIDTFVGADRPAMDRTLTGVYYFHATPKAFEGGELRLFSPLPTEQGGVYKDITPPSDSLLLFPSWVPHEVRPVSCSGGKFMQSRFAINCWYNRNHP